jgi:hypothetical protein
VVYVLGGYAMLATVLDGVANAVSLITPMIAGIVTACIVLIWGLAYFILPSHPLPWVFGNQRMLVRKLGIKPTGILVGIVLLLWVPSIITRGQTLPPQTRGSLQVDRVDIPRDYSAIAPDKQFAVNLYVLNPGPERIMNVYGYGLVSVENADDQTDHRVRIRADKELIPIREQYIADKKKGVAEVGVGKNIWTTLGTPLLTQSEVDGILKGTTRIYFVSWHAWTDSQGHKDFMYDCRWLQGYTLPAIVWHLCP